MRARTELLSTVRHIVVPIGLTIAFLSPAAVSAIDPLDPGKGFDYVFYGYSPPNPSPIVQGSSQNRAMLLLDIDDPNSPRTTAAGPYFKLLGESTVGSGVLQILAVLPRSHTLIGVQDDDPVRFLFTFAGAADNGGTLNVQSDSALEAYGDHYLRSTVDVVHQGRRTKFLVDCPVFVCEVTPGPYLLPAP